MTVPSPDARGPVVVKRNDYDAVRPPVAREPSKRVSVVIPAYGDAAKLELTLAALAAQSYPAELLEVVVADDGSEPPLRPPRLRPAHTRMVRTPDGSWGIAAAVNAAVRASDGEVVLRLDSDVVPSRRHVETHMRWHHAADYFTVIGKLAFVDVPTEWLHPVKVRDAVAAEEYEELFSGIEYDPDWQIGLVRDAGGRIDDEVRAFTAANGATISFARSVFDECGGLDESMPLGSDTEFGFRMAQAGAVFVPEAEAAAWHLGLSQMKSSKMRAGTRYRHQFMAGRVPSLRYLRNRPGLRWRLPYVEVAVTVGDARLEHVRTTLSSVLGGSLPDASVTLIGPWDSLATHRVRPLEDPQMELRLVREAFDGDPRVSFREAVGDMPESTPFRLEVDAGAALEFDGLQGLIEHADRERAGLLELVGDDGARMAVLKRTAAMHRAARLGLGDTAEAIDRVWGAAVAPASRWFRSGTGLDASLHRRRRLRELGRALAQARVEARRARRQSSRLRCLAGRVRRGLGRCLRRLLNRR